MNAALPQKRLGEVSAMSVTLADRILMERMTKGALPVAKAETLWLASLLLEENEHPVPTIVTEVLAEFRQLEAANDAGPVPDVSSRRTIAAPVRVLSRLLRPFRTEATA